MNRFWIAHAAVPGAAFALLMLVIAGSDLDTRIADALFYDRGANLWIGAHTAWANTWIHTGGRDVIRAIALSALAVLLGGTFLERLRAWRREAAFVALAMILSIGLVGLLKHLSNVDCPWSLAGYGGTHPYIPLFGDRPDHLSRAACFPGAHSSSGFALMCFYFLLRERSARAARVALGAGLAAGVLFAFGQEARGAHFLSHDLTSAVLVWYVQLGLHAGMLRHGIRYPEAERAIDLTLQPRLTT